MATVYSLICWGGRTGKTVTASNSSGLIFTTSGAHGLRDGTALQFVATTLPGNVSAGTTYYAKSLTSTTFAIYTDYALTNRVAWSSAGSAVYAKSKKMLDYFTQYPNRWGDAGAERCYDGLASFQAGRVNNAVSTVSEFCEFGEAFDEYPSAKLTLNIPAYETIIEPTVDGVFTSAWHGGVYGAGYRFVCKTELYDWGLVFSGIYQSLRGISVILTGNNCQGLYITAVLSTFRDLMIYRLGGSSGQSGLNVSGIACTVDNVLVSGIQGAGIVFSQYTGSACTVSNCLVAKGTETGISAPTEVSKHSLYNVMSVGNTTNWSAKPTGLTAAANNYGISTDSPWYVGTDTSIKTLTADNSTFIDYAGNDFRPASASAPQVDTATTLLRGYDTDIGGHERPNYNNGGAEAWDGGPFEFDHGYGDHPATATISLSNIVSGSRVLITRDDTSAVLYNDVPGASLSLSTGYIGNFSVVIRKASESPFYREFSAGGTTVANQTTSIKALQQLDE